MIHVIFLHLPDDLISPERCYPVRHHSHGGQFKSKTWERRAAAGLWSRGKHLFPQVCLLKYVYNEWIGFGFKADQWSAEMFGLQCTNTSPLNFLCMLCNPLFLCFTGSEGSNLTPAHHYGDFRFKTYAPIAFRYFRELFGIRPDDYMVFLLSWHLLYK